MLCPVCGGVMTSGTTVGHHYYHPKAKWQKAHKDEYNPIILVHTKCERQYHFYFNNRCKRDGCHNRHCRFKTICFKHK